MKAFLLLFLTFPAFAQLKLPKLFGDHMVLQRQKPVPIWGWAAPNERLTIAFNGQRKPTRADKTGRWRVNLDPMEAGGPYTLTVQSKSSALTLQDVLIGEVWVCSGQSNMEWTVRQANNPEEEMRTATFPMIRHFGVKHTIAVQPQTDVSGEWLVCNPATVGEFTAVGYFFARDLFQKLNVPIGLMHTSWGGTHSETWTSREALESDPDLRPKVANIPADIDAATRAQKEKLLQAINQKQGGNLLTPAEARASIRPGYDATTWPTMKLPQPWENDLPNLNGVAWFQREFDLPASADFNNMTLSLGKVDDIDSTFINGAFVGSRRVWDENRNYLIPTGVLKPGRNVITIRVQDGWGGGGIMGGGELFGLSGQDGTKLSLAGDWRYKIAELFPSSTESDPNTYGTLLYNAMLAPLIPMAMRGVIWYQGESNAGRAYQYRTSFPLMIQDWRNAWNRLEPSAGAFPFLFVQLANFNANNGTSQNGSTWAELREAQTLTLKLPNTGMAVTSDIGDANDIHPRNKQDVGKRLAAEAMRIVYQPTANVPSPGPMLEAVKIEGNRAILTFKNKGSGLMTPDRYGYLKGFEVAGTDQKFHYARAEIQGDSVIVYCPAVANPVAIRYGWADQNGDVNLYNKEGFPAVPFRTDSWKGVTEGVKF